MDQRHDRTTALIEEYIDNSERFFSIPITITANNEILDSSNGQIMLETLVNIVSRFTDKIVLQLPESTLSTKLQELILSTGSNIVDAEEEPEIVISVGNSNLNGKFNIRITSSGWVSYIACNANVETFSEYLQNPIGAMGAACFASAEAFKRLLEINGCNKKWATNHPTDLKFSFLDCTFSESNTDFPSTIDINNILLVGAGAVGSSFLYATSKVKDLIGTILVLDPQLIDITNLNRCLTFFVGDVDKKKAKVVERYSTDKLTINGNDAKFNEFEKENKEFPIIISTVDNNDARFDIQYDLPKIIFHGATGKSVSAVSIIKILENACLCCIFESNKSTEEIISTEMGIPLEKVIKAIKEKASFTEEHFEYLKKKLGNDASKFQNSIGKPFEDVYNKEVCGTINVSTSQGTRNASIPFVSFFSGLILLSELIKNSIPKLQQFPMMIKPDFLQLNMFSPQSYNFSRRIKNPNCPLGCSEKKVQEIYSRKWEIEA